MIIKGKLTPLRKGLLAGHAGLGDTLAAVARVTGAEAAVKGIEKVTGWRCRCPQRRAWCNEKVPYADVQR